ncbi:MAG: TonB-dependent receptor [Bacteroidales bacterium]|nr:TonB-dependent receptor [Bacteroidales bacterium]
MKGRYRRFVLLLPLLLLGFTAQAKVRTVSGTVVDETGEPVIGAGIVVNEASSVGTITDIDGAFSLTIDDAVHKSFSVVSLGYQTEVLEFTSASKYEIQLKSDANKLDDVVVVAFGTQKKLSVTGSISSVSNEDITQSVSSNFKASLAGRLPGLNITQSSGMPGNEKIDMQIRGVSTFGDSSPLILIDGVPREDMSSLDSNEVESVTVLKDAAATAVFGVRGANGVILVTTRRGMTGKATASITAEYGIQQHLTRGNLPINSWDYADLLNENSTNVGNAPAYSEWQIQQFKDGNSYYFPNRDAWQEYTQPGQQYRINANVSGGTDRISYFVNASYQHTGSIFKSTAVSDLGGYNSSHSLDRLNVRANIDFKITEDLKLGINLSSYLNKLYMPILLDDQFGGQTVVDLDQAGSDYVLYGLNMEAPVFVGPTIPANTYDNVGHLLEEGGFIMNTAAQLYARMNKSGYIHQTKTTVNSTAFLDWDMKKLVPGLRAKATFSYDIYASGLTMARRQYNWYRLMRATNPGEDSYFYQVSADYGGYYADTNLDFSYGNGGKVSGSYYKFNAQAQLSYNQTFDEKHDVSAILLGQFDNYVKNNAESLYLPYNMIYISARVGYTYDNRYTGELNLGMNASEQFSKKNRLGVFPAASLSWNLSQEHFFKDNVPSQWVDLVKFRASYGVVGNDKLSDGARFLYMDDVKVVGGGLFPSLGRGNTVVTNILGNENLTWEKAYKQNYGFDLGFLGGFTFSGDFFWEDRKDILISRGTVPLVQGLTPSMLPRVNMGRVENKGFELVLSYQKFFANDMRLNVSGNFSFARNRITQYDEVERPTGQGQYLYPYERTGFSIRNFWLLDVDYSDGGNGFINTPEDYAKYSAMYQQGGDYVRSFYGQYKFKDQNGDGAIDEKDKIPVKYGWDPEITYGFNLLWSWKGFDITMLWQGVAHKTTLITTGAFSYNGTLTGVWETQAWTAERYNNGETISFPAHHNSNYSGANANERNTAMLSDMSFIRLKNLEIGYSLPKKWMNAIKMQKIRFAISGQNLWNSTHMKAPVCDPESSNVNTYPICRSINLNVQLQF